MGCRFSPIPREIQSYHSAAHTVCSKLNPLIREGDLIFRKGHFRVLNDTINFSNLSARWCDSQFSHVGLVYERCGDSFVIVDSGSHGIERKFLIDWLIEGPENVVVKRLRHDLEQHIPRVLAVASELVELDSLHDDRYLDRDDRFYCTEVIDHSFRKAGIPLAAKIPICELPGLRRRHTRCGIWLLAHITGLDENQPVAVAGNDLYGLYSSDLLVEVAYVGNKQAPQ